MLSRKDISNKLNLNYVDYSATFDFERSIFLWRNTAQKAAMIIMKNKESKTKTVFIATSKKNPSISTVRTINLNDKITQMQISSFFHYKPP